MQLSFLAAAGPEPLRTELDRKLRRRHGTSLTASAVGDRLTLWTHSGTPLVKAADGRAAVVGLLFDSASGTSCAQLATTAEAAASILRDCWGAYVLFASHGNAHWVLRDPSGNIPVYHGVAGALHVYASDAEMLRLAWHEPLRPNLDAAREWLAFPFLRTRSTGVVGVSELLPGTVHEKQAAGAVERTLWSPAAFAEGPPGIESFSDAATSLREEILRAVPLLASGQRVILRLSGGLDSSIVAAALAYAGIDFRAVTFSTRSADGDERRFAREVADHFGIELQEMIEDDLDFSLEGETGPLRRPPNPLLQPLRRGFAAAARASGAQLILDGAGGDNVFASLNSASPAVDAFQRRGVREAIESVRDIAKLHGCTFWEAAGAAVRRWRRGRGAAWPIDRSFLAPSPLLETSNVHPWLASTGQLLPGKADHIRMITGIHHFLADPAPGEPLDLHPLIAQPILELCLRVPSWFWSAGGHNRAVARAAFRGLVPDMILDRRSKGSLESMFVKGYMAKRAELREFLASGRLADEGIIDRQAVADYLARSDQPRDALYIRLLEFASAEQWLRSFGTCLPAP